MHEVADRIEGAANGDAKPPQEINKSYARYASALRGDPKSHVPGQKLHERLGPILVRMLRSEVESRLGYDDILVATFRLVMNVVDDILQSDALKLVRTLSKTDVQLLVALHRVVDGDVDADRLDYVVRDLSVSGVRLFPLRYERLVHTFQLVEDGPKNYRFLPSVRALSEVEDFYWLRFKLYRDVLYHHRVVKTNTLLERIVVQLLEADLQDPKRAGSSRRRNRRKSGETRFHLERDISGLWMPFEILANGDGFDAEQQFVQWDDSWLLAVLRQRYFSLKSEVHKPDLPGEQGISALDGGKSVGGKRMRLFLRLDEFLTNRKRYYSLIKRFESFLEIDKIFFEELAKSLSGIAVDALARAIEKLVSFPPDRTNPAAQAFASGLLLSRRVDGYESITAEYGSVLRCFIEATAATTVIPPILKALDKATGAFLTHDLRDTVPDVVDVFWLVPETFKWALKGDIDLAEEDRAVPLSSHSNLQRELRLREQHVPAFFVFVASKPLQTGEKRDPRIGIGPARELRRLLAERLAADIGAQIMQFLDTAAQNS